MQGVWAVRHASVRDAVRHASVRDFQKYQPFANDAPHVQLDSAMERPIRALSIALSNRVWGAFSANGWHF